MFITIIEARQCSFSLITWLWLKKLLAFYLIFFQPAIIIVATWNQFSSKDIMKILLYKNWFTMQIFFILA